MQDEALTRFKNVLANPTGEHTALIDLSKDGWIETCPSEYCWHFHHPAYPGINVDWPHGQGPVAWRSE